MLVAHLAEAVENACGESEHEEVEVHKERRPGGRLMLRDRRDDRDIPSDCEQEDIH